MGEVCVKQVHHAVSTSDWSCLTSWGRPLLLPCLLHAKARCCRVASLQPGRSEVLALRRLLESHCAQLSHSEGLGPGQCKCRSRLTTRSGPIVTE